MTLKRLESKPLKIILGIIIVAAIFAGGFYANKIFNRGINLKFWQKNEVSQLSKENAYKAIVEIKTISKDDEYNMAEDSNGSGIVISSSGLVLTNYHVVSSEDGFHNLKETGYTICFSQDTSLAPVCNYEAKLISRDKDLDLAILQIVPIEGLSQPKVFDYLSINTVDQTAIGDAITVLGYPGIGDDTITITGGIVSGKNDKYDEKWIKTDAVVSFGNSGGAIIDSLGRVIGLTSASHADTLGSLGYAINVISINKWLENNKNKPAEELSFKSDLEKFIKKQNDLLVGDVFTNNQPNFTLTKPSDWEFEYTSERAVYIDKKSDDEGGSFLITYNKRPTAVGLDNVTPFFKENILNNYFYFPTIINEDTTTIAQQPAKKIIYYDNKNNKSNVYIMPFENYFIKVYYYYGKEDKDKKNIDSILSSLKFKKSDKPYTEVKEYDNKEFGFKLILDSDWALMTANDVTNPVNLVNKENKNVIFSINVEKTDEANKSFTNEQYLDDIKKLYDESNKSAASSNFYIDLTETNPDISIGNVFVHAMKTKTAMFGSDKKKIESESVEYKKKIGDKYVSINFYLFSDDITTYNQAQADLDKLMTALTVSDK